MGPVTVGVGWFAYESLLRLFCLFLGMFEILSNERLSKQYQNSSS